MNITTKWAYIACLCGSDMITTYANDIPLLTCCWTCQRTPLDLLQRKVGLDDG